MFRQIKHFFSRFVLVLVLVLVPTGLFSFGGVVAQDPIKLKLTPDVQFLYSAGGVRVILTMHNTGAMERKFHVCQQVPLYSYFSFIIRKGAKIEDGRETTIMANIDDVKFTHKSTDFILKPGFGETMVVNLNDLLDERQRLTEGIYYVKAILALDDVVVESNEVMFELSKL